MRALPADQVREVVVCDNGSSDGTARVAAEAGATVVSAPRRGYGSACLAGLAHLGERAPRFVAFLDAGMTDRPEELPLLIAPLLEGYADLAIGSRVSGKAEPGSLSPVQRLGNGLATSMIHALTGYKFTDLGPFRAARWTSLRSLEMRETGSAWMVEMQVKAARRGLRCVEIPVTCRRRVGRSKISVGASLKIPFLILGEAFRPRA